ncbi:MAG: DUF3574 domain-containing protein [Burkholderiaceae bacterium]
MSLHFSPLSALRATCILLFSLCVCACATNPIGSLPGCSQQVATRMYFGLHSPNAVVSDAQWKDFLTTQITPRFPDGLTVLAGNGQWRSTQGAIISEDSRVVEVVHQSEEAIAVKIQAITRLYKSNFAQESVLVLQQPVTACF